MNEPLRQLLVTAPGAGSLDGPAVCSGRASHPVCGDEVEVDLDVRDGVVAAYRWRASGCPATTAVAAAATEVWDRGQLPATELEASLRRRLGHLGGLARHEHHAVGLLLRAASDALNGAGT